MEDTKNNIPEGWHTYTLGEIYTERKEAGDPELPILTVSIHSGVSDGALGEEEIGKTVKRIVDRTQYKTARAGDLVFNMMRAWQGAIGVARSDGLVSPAYIVATPNEELVYPLFMDYYMKSPKMVGIINRQSYGVTDFRKRLYWDSFAPIKCTLPSISEQKKIVAVLETQDKIISLRERFLLYKQKNKQYMLTKLISGTKRFSGFDEPWMQTTLGQVSIMYSGGTPDSKVPDYYGNDHVWVSISDMSATNKYIHSSERKITKLGLENSSAKIYPKGTVLFAMYASIGECKIADVECCSSQAILGIQPNAGLNNEFLYYYLSSKRDFFSALGQASSQPNLNKKIVEDFKINLPSLVEQKAITEVLSKADKEIELLQQTITQEKQKKKALMQLLLAGIVRV